MSAEFGFNEWAMIGMLSVPFLLCVEAGIYVMFFDKRKTQIEE